MNKKILVYGLSIVVTSLILAGAAVYKSISENTNNYIGKLLLEKTYNQAVKVSKIVITTPRKQISMYLKDNFWRVEEADDYYASLIISNAFFISVNNAEIRAIPHISEEELSKAALGNPKEGDANSGILIETYSENGELIEDMIIGNWKNNFQYAKRPNSSEILLTSGNFELPDTVFSWLQQPILNLNPATVEQLTLSSGDDIQEAVRQEDKTFKNHKGEKTNPNPFLESLKNLIFTEVVKEENFNKENTEQQRDIKITLENGLIHNINLLKKQDEYWISIKNSTTTLPTQTADDYISESSFLTDGWRFKIRPEIGKLLLNFEIGSSKIYVKSID